MTAPDPSEDDYGRRATLIGAVIAIVLVLGGWWLVRELTAASRMQDCLMSGRSNCNPIEIER